MNEWLAGETAPKDGTKFLAWTGIGFEITEWCAHEQERYVPAAVHGLYRREVTMRGYWNSNVPLFWTPLPPPVSDEDAGTAWKDMIAREGNQNHA